MVKDLRYPVEILHFYTFNALVGSLPTRGAVSRISNGKKWLPPPQELRVDYCPINNCSYIMIVSISFVKLGAKIILLYLLVGGHSRNPIFR